MPSSADESVRTTTFVRWIEFAGCENFRDLGGLVTSTGVPVRYGQLYRSDTLDCLTNDDHISFAALGIHTVIDLRAPSEIAKRGRIDLERQHVRYLNLPLVNTVGGSVRDPVEAARFEYPILGYQQTLAEGPDRMAAVLRALAEPEALPAVFHCFSGKDRTGLVAAVILRLLGVSESQIASEYALSQGRNRHSLASDEQKRMFPRIFGAPPDVIQAVLRGLEEVHDSIEGYVRSIGVEAEAVERLRAALLARETG
jgi:protein tyrosine/serine phosphatase